MQARHPLPPLDCPLPTTAPTNPAPPLPQRLKHHHLILHILIHAPPVRHLALQLSHHPLHELLEHVVWGVGFRFTVVEPVAPEPVSAGGFGDEEEVEAFWVAAFFRYGEGDGEGGWVGGVEFGGEFGFQGCDECGRGGEDGRRDADDGSSVLGLEVKGGEGGTGG